MKIYTQILAIAIAVFCSFLVWENSADESEQLETIRVPLMDPQISKELLDLNQSLMVASHPKELTESEKNWRNVFLISIKNWFNLLEAIQETETFKEKVRANEEGRFDAWITGGYSKYFQMTYEFPQDPEMEQVWNIVIYSISADGLDTSKIKLENADITFQMSNEKLALPDDGGFDYRKDRVFTAAVTMEIGSSLVKIFHEIVQDGEQPIYKYRMRHEDKKSWPGKIRLVLSDVKIYLQLSVTEIDKRFLIKNENDDIENYFQMPVIEDLQISIGDVWHGIDTYQELEGFKDVNMEPEDYEKLTEQERLDLKKELIGKDLDVAKADNIIDDFVAFLKSKEHNKELVNRLKVALINKFSKAIMSAPDVTAFAENIVQECFYYSPFFSHSYDSETINEHRMILFMSYSYQSLVDGIFQMIATWIADQNDDSLFDQGDALLKKQTEAIGSSIYESDGFDDKEDLEATHNKYIEEQNAIQAAIEAEKKKSVEADKKKSKKGGKDKEGRK